MAHLFSERMGSFGSKAVTFALLTSISAKSFTSLRKAHAATGNSSFVLFEPVFNRFNDSA